MKPNKTELTDEIKIKIYQYPEQNDANIYRLKKAFEAASRCPFCNSDNIKMIYTGPDYLDETVFEWFDRVVKNRVVHTICCTCQDCQSQYGSQFIATNKCRNLQPIFNELYDPGKVYLQKDSKSQHQEKYESSYYEV